MKYMENFKIEIKRLLKLGVIERSQSSYATPCFLAIKSDCEISLILDYRKLNAKKKPSYTLFSARTGLFFPNEGSNFFLIVRYACGILSS